MYPFVYFYMSYINNFINYSKQVIRYCLIFVILFNKRRFRVVPKVLGQTASRFPTRTKSKTGENIYFYKNENWN